MGPYFACAIWIICCNSASLSSAALCARSEARSASGVIGGNGEIAARHELNGASADVTGEITAKDSGWMLARAYRE